MNIPPVKWVPWVRLLSGPKPYEWRRVRLFTGNVEREFDTELGCLDALHHYLVGKKKRTTISRCACRVGETPYLTQETQ